MRPMEVEVDTYGKLGDERTLREKWTIKVDIRIY